MILHSYFMSLLQLFNGRDFNVDGSKVALNTSSYTSDMEHYSDSDLDQDYEVEIAIITSSLVILIIDFHLYHTFYFILVLYFIDQNT